MSEVVRLFQSAVDPADVDIVRRLFLDDVKPVFERIPGCIDIRLLISTDKNAGGLVEGAAMSRWESREAMESGLLSREANEALVRVMEVLRQEPVSRVFEVEA